MVTGRTASAVVAGAAALAASAALAMGPASIPGAGPSSTDTGMRGGSLQEPPLPPLTQQAPSPPDEGSPGPSVTGYVWPTGEPVTVLRPFDRPPEPWLSGHRGVDLDLLPGSPVASAGDGVVAFAGPVAGRPVISILHGDGLRTTYEPVVPVVVAGQHVRAGELIGTIGTGGHCACLHWGARRGADDYVDPLALLRSPVRLLPE